jgi:ribosome-binding protein aMBF1 (putative translation factor)
VKPTTKPERSPPQRAEEEAIRREHKLQPMRQRPAGAVNQQSFGSILSLLARFKAAREAQGLTLVEVAQKMEIDAPALSRLESGKVLNPTLATLHKWAEALGQRLTVDLSSQ